VTAVVSQKKAPPCERKRKERQIRKKGENLPERPQNPSEETRSVQKGRYIGSSKQLGRSEKAKIHERAVELSQKQLTSPTSERRVQTLEKR